MGFRFASHHKQDMTMKSGCHSPMFWNELFPHICKTRRRSVSKTFGGYRLGVDMSSWLLSDGYAELSDAVMLNRPSYTPHRLLRLIELRHKRLCEAYIVPVYVFPGSLNPKQIVTSDAKNARTYINGVFEEAQKKPINRTDIRKTLNASLRNCQVIDPGLIHFLGQWMKSKGNMEVVNAPFETTWQLLEMERANDTQGSISEDGTLVMAGAQLVLFGSNFAPFDVEARVFDRSKDVEQKARRYDFSTHSEFLPEAATLYGTRYWERTKHTVKDVIRIHWPKLVASIRDGEATADHSLNVAINQLRYGPVVRTIDNGECTVEPLNLLPNGSSTWEDLLGFDPIEYLKVSNDDYAKARGFEDNLSFALSTFTQQPWLQNLKCELNNGQNHANSDSEDDKEDIPW